MELKQHVSTQRKLVYDLMHGTHLEVLSEESIESLIDDTLDAEQSPHMRKFETYTNVIIETLDILLSEHRLDEALLILEMGPLEEEFPPEVVMSYNAAVSERRKILANQFFLLAEHPRIAAPEFQKALSGLTRLGDSHRANILLLQYYGSRFEQGMLELQHAEPCLQETYIRELSKHVFSVISQAARSSVTLHGETSSYTSEFMQWAQEKTEVFVCFFDKHVKLISETTGGFCLAVEAVQHALSFCSLLEPQKILLRPFLIKLIRPCMEMVFQMHIDHVKKVIDIFTSTDAWVPGKYLVSSLLKDMPLPLHTGADGNLEFCLLTNSGRKLVTALKVTINDISPLGSLQMEHSILRGLCDLFNTYVDMLQRSIPNKANVVDRSSQRTNLASTLYQELSLLANAFTLVLHFFPSIAESVFRGTKCSGDKVLTENEEHIQQKELNGWILSIQEAADRLRGHFCKQFVTRVMLLEVGNNLIPEINIDGQSESGSLPDLLPSTSFQVLFIQLRELERLAKEVFVGMDWEVEDLLRELMEALFSWLSNNQEFWTVNGKNSTAEQSSSFDQFLLDMQFLLEMARYGGYLSDNLMDSYMVLIECLETSFVAAGLDPDSDILHDGWATMVAKAAIDKLQEIDETKLPSLQEAAGSRGAKDFVKEDVGRPSEDSIGSGDVNTANEAEATSELQDMVKAVMAPMEELTDVDEEVDRADTSRSLSDNCADLEDDQAANMNTIMFQGLEELELPSSESSSGFLVEDSDNETAQACIKEGPKSSLSDSEGKLDIQAGNVDDSVIDHISEPEISTVAGTDQFLEEDILHLQGGCPANESQVDIVKQSESERVESPAKKGHESILQLGSDEQEE